MPEVKLGLFNFFSFRIRFNFSDNFINFLGFKINNVIHYSLSLTNMIGKKREVEFSLRSKWILYVAVKVDSE